MNPTSYTVNQLLQFPLDDLDPSVLATRTTTQQGQIVAHLVKNKEIIQSIFEQMVLPVIEIQNEVRGNLANKMILETDLIESDVFEVVTKNLGVYFGALGPASQILLEKGFPDFTFYNQYR